MNIKRSSLELIGNTPLLELSHLEKEFNLKAKLLGKLEYLNLTGSVKDRIAKAMIEVAARMGRDPTPVWLQNLMGGPCGSGCIAPRLKN